MELKLIKVLNSFFCCSILIVPDGIETTKKKSVGKQFFYFNRTRWNWNQVNET